MSKPLVFALLGMVWCWRAYVALIPIVLGSLHLGVQTGTISLPPCSKWASTTKPRPSRRTSGRSRRRFGGLIDADQPLPRVDAGSGALPVGSGAPGTKYISVKGEVFCGETKASKVVVKLFDSLTGTPLFIHYTLIWRRLR